MHKKPLISIITPVYNQERFIEQTIRSVLGQTYQNWEWIILDDGSTDGTGETITKVKDNRIKYYFQEHAGSKHLTKTFNKALDLCNGALIAMLDSDDYWPEYKLEVQMQCFENPDIVLSYGECRVISTKEKNISYINIPSDIHIACNNPVGSSLKILLQKNYNFIANSTVMLSKSSLLNIGGFVDAKGRAQDFTTWSRLSLEGSFSPIPRCIGFWRRHASSTNLKCNQEILFEAGIAFLKDFVVRNNNKLQDLGFFYDLDSLEKDWQELRREHIHFLPYNRAMLLLRLGLFREAQAEFKKFKGLHPSVKHGIIYSLINLSCVIKMDLVNPSAGLKNKFQGIFQKNKGLMT